MTRERPILFSAPMVRAILDGRKTQTRRVMKPQPVPNQHAPGKHWVAVHCVQSMVEVEDELQGVDTSMAHCLNPYGKPGDHLWVRETFAFYDDGLDGGLSVAYKADDGKSVRRWSPSIHMPRSESRITLEITDVRVQRLQDISENDARAEGCVRGDEYDDIALRALDMDTGQAHYLTARDSFQFLWHSIHGSSNVKAWESNPWVWAITFKRVQP